MKLRNLYLLPFLVLLAACSGSEEKVLYPTKMTIGSTTHEFLYADGRIYSVTTTRPDFYEEVTYRYRDEVFPDVRPGDENKILNINYEPDNGIIGWDSSDSIERKQELFTNRSDAGLVMEESQNVYLHHRNVSHDIKHTYDAANRLAESTYYFADHTKWNEEEAKDPDWLVRRIRQTSVVSKQVKYEYAQGKLAKVGFYAPGGERPYLQIELTYDDRPGYLSSLPLEARFMPLELPYREHNIVSYTVKDIYGKVRKDLSYTCSYTYNKAGYPVKFTRKMGDGLEIEGHIYYRAAVDNITDMLSVK